VSNVIILVTSGAAQCLTYDVTGQHCHTGKLITFNPSTVKTDVLARERQRRIRRYE